MAIKYPAATAEQSRAWDYYGRPRKSVANTSTTTQPPIGNQVGEVRYIIGWMADQMVRMGWRVAVNGKESWSIQTESGPITSDSQQTDIEQDNHPTNASRRLLDVIEWDSRTVREVTTNLFVAGELHYARDSERWRVVSVIRPDRDEILNRSSLKIHGIWPHPADPEAPDAPLFGVLGVLDDMAWLNRLSRSQSANRVGMRGIVGVADTMTTASGESGDAFWAAFEASLSKAMDDPEDVSPVGVVGPQELIEPEGNGMKGLSWVIPNFPYDDKVDERMHALVQRLAYGLPIPPEILLGLQAQSKATAFQVEGSTYRAHIEPVALLVSRIATDALAAFLPDELGKAEVIPDPTAILARRHSVSDVIEAFDRGAANFEYLREVLGIPDRAKLSDEDLALRDRVGGKRTGFTGEQDPATVAARDPQMALRPITAAATLPSEDVDEVAPSAPSADDTWLEDRLHQIDQMAFYELVGASAQAVSRAREKLGARIRANETLRRHCPADFSNEELATKIGRDSLESVGIPVQEVIDGAIKPTLKWWEDRAAKAQQEVADTLEVGDAVVEYGQEGIPASVERLTQIISASVFSDGDVPERTLRGVLDDAGK